MVVATRLTSEGLDALLEPLVRAAGIEPVWPGRPVGVDVVQRRSDSDTDSDTWTFVIDQSGLGVSVPLNGTDLVSGETCSTEQPLRVAPGGCAVVHSHLPTGDDA